MDFFSKTKGFWPKEYEIFGSKMLLVSRVGLLEWLSEKLKVVRVDSFQKCEFLMNLY